MIQTTRFDVGQRDAVVGRIVLRPNNSLSWRATKLFLIGLTVLSLTVAGGFLLQGYWMILPFTLVELTIISTCFYVIARRTQRQEVVAMSADSIYVESGVDRVDRRVAWQRFFTKILIVPGRHPWHSPRIELRHRNDVLEIGGFLAQDEKQTLAEELRSLVRDADRAAAHAG